MWLYTQHGFYSIVAHRDQPGRFLVRARRQIDLDNLRSLAGLPASIQSTPDADYHFRLTITAAELNRVMTVLGNTVDYPNFKNRIAARPDQADRLHIYHNIWDETNRLSGT